MPCYSSRHVIVGGVFIKLTLGDTVLISAFHSVSALFAEREHSVCNLQHGTQSVVCV